MPQSLEDILLIVWRQTLIEHSNTVNVDGHTYPVQITKGRRLEQVDFSFGERNLRGLEQNPAGAIMADTLEIDWRGILRPDREQHRTATTPPASDSLHIPVSA